MFAGEGVLKSYMHGHYNFSKRPKWRHSIHEWCLANKSFEENSGNKFSNDNAGNAGADEDTKMGEASGDDAGPDAALPVM